MRRTATTIIATVCGVLLTASMASAASQTVAGDEFGGTVGDIKKIVVNNGQNALSTKVFGLGKPCGGAKYIHVYVQNGRGKTLYTAEAGCYSGDTGPVWLTGLYDDSGSKVRCRDFDVSRNRSTGAYQVLMPRGCLGDAPNRIRVDVTGQNWGSLTGGHAGPTRILDRG